MAIDIRVLESSDSGGGGGDVPIPTPSDMETIASTAIYDKAKSGIAELIEYYAGCGQRCCTICIKFPPGLREELEENGYTVVERGDFRKDLESYVYDILW